MNAHRWMYIGMILFAAAALSLVSTPARVQSDPRLQSDSRRVADAGLDQESARRLLKGYEALWMNPDPATLRAAEEELLEMLSQLPPHELVALVRQGVSTRAANLVLITLENAMRGARRNDYENALVAGMERVFEQPDKLAILSDVTLRSNPSRENAEVAARLLMQREPAGKLAEHLGAFASRLESGPRDEVKQFAVKHDLIETLGYLVDDWSDVARLQDFLGDPATRDRAGRALERANQSVTSEELRLQIRGTLE